MAVQLSDTAKALFDGTPFVSVATIQPDGSPQLSVVWARMDGDDVLFSTVEGRRKHLNLVRDPRLTLMVNPADAPYGYVEVRGEATLSTENGRALIDELSQRYLGREYMAEPPETVRVVVRVTPHKVIERG
jgi:PPOX class probable F420-dependent enzyme